MYREYKFEQKVTREVVDELLKEAKQLEGLQDIKVTEDLAAVRVKAEVEDYPRLMERILNIASRYANYRAGNAIITFSRFVYDEEA